MIISIIIIISHSVASASYLILRAFRAADKALTFTLVRVSAALDYREGTSQS